jgi:hypothetical protein
VVDADLSAWSVEVGSPDGSSAEQHWREQARGAVLARASPASPERWRVKQETTRAFGNIHDSGIVEPSALKY